MKLQDFEGMEGLENIRGYIALFDAIMENKSANKALKRLDAVPEKPPKRDGVNKLINLDFNRNFDNAREEAGYMTKLKKKGMSYRRIAEFFDISQRTVFLRVRKYMKKQGDWEDRSWRSD